ncbi:MAG: DUF1844 domain-containing protein [Planctomycetaceae bacterium]|jgi:hypothetical protein|nr:DUF1844 domain-containing protein [Planctomycetaceae bacterium]MBT6153699.1 DUF1844 domain-containing protein [Planctomycetaceae bacterium]MBT6487634.1 DUF1844 domain-containing protein [Planctomycetaceae bacterium]MBT6494502.1 DUF1844 domain-containing protein [Planctomycetaceae bacterium]
MTMDDAKPSTNAADEPEIQADEEWKQQVKADDAALDEAINSEALGDDAPSTEEAAASGAESQPMPPPTFEVLVSMFSTQAMVALGLIPNPATGKAEVLPDLAKHFIDMLSVLETKTAGNLEPHEKTLLDSSLHQLRMAFVQATKK